MPDLLRLISAEVMGEVRKDLNKERDPAAIGVLADEIMALVQDQVKRATEPLLARIAALEARGPTSKTVTLIRDDAGTLIGMKTEPAK